MSGVSGDTPRFSLQAAVEVVVQVDGTFVEAVVVRAGAIVRPGGGDAIDLLLGATLEGLLDLCLHFFNAEDGHNKFPEPKLAAMRMKLRLRHERVLRRAKRVA